MRIFSHHKSTGHYWFRIFGYGLTIKDTAKCYLTFSERYGYIKKIKIGKYLIGGLKP